MAGIKPKPPLGSTIVFKSVGIAVEDIATARLVYEAIQVVQIVKDSETRKHQPRAS